MKSKTGSSKRLGANIKILCMLPMWGRHEAAHICFKGLQRSIGEAKAVGVDMEVLVIASKDSDAQLVEEYGFNIALAPNDPLGEKSNMGLAAAMSYDWDYLLTTGADNLFGVAMIEGYLRVIADYKPDFFGTKRVSMIQMSTGKKMDITYPCFSGVARMHSRAMIERACFCTVGTSLVTHSGRFGQSKAGNTVYMPINASTNEPVKYYGTSWHLWPDNSSHTTDIDSEVWLQMNGYKCLEISTEVPYIVDLKDAGSLTKFKQFDDKKLNLPVIDEADIERFPELKDLINK